MRSTPRPVVLRRLAIAVAVVLGFIAAASIGHAQGFVHPGGLHTLADLDRMKTHVAAGDHPWIDSWNALVTDSRATATYNPAPQANIGANRQRASADAVAAYLEAIRGYVSGDTSYTDNAIRICNLWSAAVNQVPSGTDQPGLNGLYSYQFAVVGEILRIYVGTRWAESDFQRFQAMLSVYLYPACHDFLVRHNNACISHYWANWDASNVVAIAAIGVCCDDQAKFDEAVDYYKNGAGNGSIANAVFAVHPGGPDEPYGLGQWQESGRDQEHNNLGVGLLATFCEIAWNQGLDLFSYDNNRLLAGAEYVAGYALWQDVPYTTYNNCDPVNQYWISRSQRGRLQRPIWELIYNHYVVRRGLTAPNVAAIAALNRPEAYTHDDHFGYGSLAFTLDASASPLPAAAPAVPTNLAAAPGAGRVYLSWTSVPGANGYTIKRATSAGGPFTALSAYRGTEAEYYDTAVTNGTAYYYTVASINQAGTSADSVAVSGTPQATSPSLPAGWLRRDLGTVSSAGTASYSTIAGNTFSIAGSGAAIGSTADGCSFLFSEVTGDTSITARLIDWNLSGAGGSGKLGIMIRESLAPGAKTATLMVGDVGFREGKFGARVSDGAGMSFVLGNDYSSTLPVWLRLQRAGDTFIASESDDGLNWFTVGSTTIVMNSVSLVGFAVASNSTSTISATFDSVTLTGVRMPSAPTGLTAVNGNYQVSLFWNASSGATGYDVKRATTSGGPYAVIASGITATSYVDTGLTQGANYYYVVSTRQDVYESVDSAEAIGTPGDIRLTWSATPTSGAWSVGVNWIGGNPPITGAALTFGATSVSSLTNDQSSLSVNGIGFSAGAPAYTIGGNALALAGDIANNASTTQTFSLPLQLSNSVAITTTTGTVAITGVISGASSANGLTKAGAQPLSLTGLNTFAGPFTLASGTVSIAGIGAGSAGSPTAGALGRGTVTLNGGTLTSSAAATIYNNVVVPAGATVNLASTTANLTIAGNLSGTGTINESGANTGGTYFNGDNSGFTGTFNSSNATNHRVRFNAPTAGSANAAWVLNNSQTDGYGFNFGNGTISFGALSGGGVFRNDSSASTSLVVMSIGALNTNTTYSGSIVQNSGRQIGVAKVGTGTLTISGNGNTYTGGTTVTAGTLLVNGTIVGNTTVTVGTLGGSGKAGNVTVGIGSGAGSILAPGNATIGNFTATGSLALNADATLAVQINSSTGAADKVSAANVTLNNATLAIAELGSGALPYGTAFTIVDNTGTLPVSGTFSGLPEGAMFTAAANLFRISYQGGTGNDVVLTAIVPPPAITSPSTATATVGVPFSYTITATNSPTTIDAAGLPPGLALDAATGIISGTPTAAGSVTATISVANTTGSATAPLTVTIGKGAATIALDGLTQTYTGNPMAVTATTLPSGLSVTITYNGSTNVPVNAGSYSVAARVDDPNYQGAATGTLTIAPATAVIAVVPYSVTYDGHPHSAIGTATGVRGEPLAGLVLNGTTHTNANTYVDTWTFADPNGNYSPTSGQVTDVIAKATATLAVTPLAQRYDGTPRPVTATTSPANLAVAIMYDGAADAPIYPGEHTVVATVTDPNYDGTTTATLVIGITALVRHAPTLNGDLDGSAQVLGGESFSLNSSGGVSGDLLLPGTPTIQLNGMPTVAGINDGPGAAEPSGYGVTINHGAVLRYAVRRIDPIAIPTVDAPPSPSGTRDLTINRSGQSLGDANTLRNLTLNSNAGTVTLPAGTYGAVVVNGATTLVLGSADSAEPAAYNLQSLTVNSHASVQLAGPVILTLANGASLNGSLNATAAVSLLTVRIAATGLTLNSGATLHGSVIAPMTSVTINNGGTLIGSIVADTLTLSGTVAEQTP